jgi:hypothetical protein
MVTKLVATTGSVHLLCRIHLVVCVYIYRHTHIHTQQYLSGLSNGIDLTKQSIIMIYFCNKKIVDHGHQFLGIKSIKILLIRNMAS